MTQHEPTHPEVEGGGREWREMGEMGSAPAVLISPAAPWWPVLHRQPSHFLNSASIVEVLVTGRRGLYVCAYIRPYGPTGNMTTAGTSI